MGPCCMVNTHLKCYPAHGTRGGGGVGGGTDCYRLLNALEPKLDVLLVTCTQIPCSWGMGEGTLQDC